MLLPIRTSICGTCVTCKEWQPCCAAHLPEVNLLRQKPSHCPCSQLNSSSLVVKVEATWSVEAKPEWSCHKFTEPPAAANPLGKGEAAPPCGARKSSWVLMLGAVSTSTAWTLLCLQTTWDLVKRQIFTLPLKKTLKFCISNKFLSAVDGSTYCKSL